MKRISGSQNLNSIDLTLKMMMAFVSLPSGLT